jgi:hypothetical protein
MWSIFFGAKISPLGNKKIGPSNPTKDFFGKNYTNWPYVNEKKVQFIRFKTSLLGCHQIIVGLQNIFNFPFIM